MDAYVYAIEVQNKETGLWKEIDKVESWKVVRESSWLSPKQREHIPAAENRIKARKIAENISNSEICSVRITLYSVCFEFEDKRNDGIEIWRNGKWL